jgi:hypothetical protein
MTSDYIFASDPCRQDWIKVLKALKENPYTHVSPAMLNSLQSSGLVFSHILEGKEKIELTSAGKSLTYKD